MDEQATEFRGQDILQEEVRKLSTPYSFFLYFSRKYLEVHPFHVSYIAEETLRFSVQSDPIKPYAITTN